MKTTRSIFLLFFLPLLGGCQSSSTVDDLLAGRQVDYQQDIAQQQRQLQYPPDLIAIGTDIEGTVSLSEYAIRGLPELSEDIGADLSQPVEVAYRRDGRVRWIVAKRLPDLLWKQIQDFWITDLGFPLVQENEQTGIMETDWLDLRRQADAPGALRYFDKFVNLVRDSGDRDKFITRLEFNEAGETDIYISHRHIIGRFDAQTGSFAGYDPGPNAVELEIEMLRRMIIYLTKQGEENAKLDAEIADAEVSGEAGDYEYNDTELLIRRSFLDSWRLMQIALDRGGFTIEDRDYDAGIIYIRHSGGPESDQIFGKQSEGLFSTLFGKDAPLVRNIKLLLQTEDGITRVTAETTEADPDDEDAEEAEPLTEEQQSIVLNLLYERLP